jgi:hypothetical protein
VKTKSPRRDLNARPKVYETFFLFLFTTTLFLLTKCYQPCSKEKELKMDMGLCRRSYSSASPILLMMNSDDVATTINTTARTERGGCLLGYLCQLHNAVWILNLHKHDLGRSFLLEKSSLSKYKILIITCIVFLLHGIIWSS